MIIIFVQLMCQMSFKASENLAAGEFTNFGFAESQLRGLRSHDT